MKLLLDQNLSPKLCKSLHPLYEKVTHVRDAGLANAADSEVWKFAAENGFTIVSKDSDFNQLSLLFGPPPKVIWIALGNCSTKDLEFILQARRSDLIEFSQDAGSAVLNLSPEF